MNGLKVSVSEECRALLISVFFGHRHTLKGRDLRRIIPLLHQQPDLVLVNGVVEAGPTLRELAEIIRHAGEREQVKHVRDEAIERVKEARKQVHDAVASALSKGVDPRLLGEDR